MSLDMGEQNIPQEGQPECPSNRTYAKYAPKWTGQMSFKMNKVNIVKEGKQNTFMMIIPLIKCPMEKFQYLIPRINTAVFSQLFFSFYT